MGTVTDGDRREGGGCLRSRCPFDRDRSEGGGRVRRKLARSYFGEAERALARGDFRSCAASSQLAAENAAKAIIALFGVLSCSHDPSPELEEVIRELLLELREKAGRVAEIAHELAPEHGRAVYGEPTVGPTPWDLYDEATARRLLERAREAVELAEEMLERLLGDRD